MDPRRGRRPALRRAGWLALVTVVAGLAVAGCQATGSAGPAAASPGAASASPGFSVPGTHRTTATYRVSSPVSTVIVTSHVGNVTVTGGSGPGVTVTQQADYSRTPPVTTRAVSGTTLTVTYTCPAQVICGVAYTLQVPRAVTVQVTTGTGEIRLGGLAGSVTAKADAGIISATGLTGASVSLTTEVGAISASFAAVPAAVRAVAHVGAITLRLPAAASYRVTATAHLGKTSVSTRQSASSAHVVTATTDVGAIVVAPSSQ